MTEEEFQAAYQLSHAIGAGGAGEVWLATQRSLSRLVVVKFIRPEMMADENSQRRFEREARVLARLSHPHIVPVYESGAREGRPYLVMEYIAGGSLSARMSGDQHPGDLVALRIAFQIADGLDCLHEAGIVHRDVKPGNILLHDSRTGCIAKLADFGLARHAADRTLTSQGPLLGTPHYVAPEVLLGADPSPQSDLYALGVVLYQLLARQLPWPDSADVTELIARRVNVPPEPLQRYREDLPVPLTALVNRLLIPDPERRPGSARELRQTLEEVTDQSFSIMRPTPRTNASTDQKTSMEGITPVSTPAPRPASRPASRPPVASGIGGGRALRWGAFPALALLVGLGVWLAATRISEPFRLAGFAEARPRVGGLEVLYRTNRPCPTQLTVLEAESSVSRLVAPGDPPSTEHRAVLSDLREGRAVKLTVQFPDGGSAALSATVPVLVAKPLVAERLPRRVSVELATALKATLKVDVTQVGGTGSATRGAASAPGNAHHVELDGLDPRLTYELRARVLPEGGEERPLPRVTLESPIEQLLALARAVRGANLANDLDALEKTRRTPAEPARLEPVLKLLEGVGLPQRREELVRVLPRAQLDRELTADEKRQVYAGLFDLRLVDRYCAGHHLPFTTGVEKLMPPDLAWGDAPLWPIGSPDAWTPFPKGEGLMPASESHVNVWAGSERLTETTTVTLAVPPLGNARAAQMVLKVRHNRASGYLVDADTFPMRLLFVPSDETVFKPGLATMYHALPVSWLKPGPMALTLRLRILPGFYKNVRSEGTVIFSDLRANCPVPEELGLYLYGGPSSSDIEAH